MIGNKNITLLAIIAAVLIGVGGVLLVFTDSPPAKEAAPEVRHQAVSESNRGVSRNESSRNHDQEEVNIRPGTVSNEYTGNALQLPFNLRDIEEQEGGVNPLGVVRFSKDLPEFGHSGIDMPLAQNAPVYAVADGEVVIIQSAADPWGGQGISHLIQPSIEGEGWLYIYEHVTPKVGLKAGDKIKTGEQIATKTAPAAFTAHFQMSYSFNNYEYTRAMVCWVDFLNTSSKNDYLNWWKDYSSTNEFIKGWSQNIEEGTSPFRGLLNTAKFPDGPQLCYPLGTDVR